MRRPRSALRSWASRGGPWILRSLAALLLFIALQLVCHSRPLAYLHHPTFTPTPLPSCSSQFDTGLRMLAQGILAIYQQLVE